MPAPMRSISNPCLSTRQPPKPKPNPVTGKLNNELSIELTSPTNSMGPQPRPNSCPIPVPLNENEGLSIDTPSPMASIHCLQEVYGCKAEVMRQKSLKCPQALALSSDDDVLSSPLVPHVGWKRLQVLPQILSTPLPRLSAPDTMDPLDRARVLVKLLPDSVPEAKEVDKIYELGALCPEVFTQTNCKESMAADWEYIYPIYNRILGSLFSVHVLSCYIS